MGTKRAVRKTCEVILDGIDIPDPFDLTVFCDRLAARRGKPLHLQALDGISAAEIPCGVYFSLPTADYIFYDGNTSALHREHIVLHEISHMLFGHAAGAAAMAEVTARLMPDIDPKTLRAVLGRTKYTTQHEREAETLASLIRGETLRRRVIGAGADPAQARVLSRLQSTLEQRDAQRGGRHGECD